MTFPRVDTSQVLQPADDGLLRIVANPAWGWKIGQRVYLSEDGGPSQLHEIIGHEPGVHLLRCDHPPA